jgi:hypothetical protein
LSLQAAFNPFRSVVNKSPQSPNPIIGSAAQMRDGHYPKSVCLRQINDAEGKAFCFPTAGSKPARLADFWITLNFRQRFLDS